MKLDLLPIFWYESIQLPLNAYQNTVIYSWFKSCVYHHNPGKYQKMYSIQQVYVCFLVDSLY